MIFSILTLILLDVVEVECGIRLSCDLEYWRCRVALRIVAQTFSLAECIEISDFYD